MHSRFLLTGALALSTASVALAQKSESIPSDFAVAQERSIVETSVLGGGPAAEQTFKRIASFLVYENTDIEDETVSEIVSATEDGMTLVYTDSEQELIGFVDITDPADPVADGVVELDGEPTSVAVRGDYAIAAVNTGADFINTSGQLDIIDIDTRTIVRTIQLGGQPDSIAVSPDGRYGAVAIENERDEDLGDGEPPQAPAGFVVIVDFVGGVNNWSTRTVNLVGVPTLYPNDPEPEFIDINAFNVAAVTLQENNHIALIWLPLGVVIKDYSAGSIDLDQIDTNENDLIEQNASLVDVPREPDAIAWTSAITFATADEGDLFGGSRGFTTWLSPGVPLYEPGNDLEHLVAHIGHYPEDRSENKGNEPESVTSDWFNGQNYLFVGSERSSIVFVYKLASFPVLGALFPELVQVLPTGVAPEGLLTIPHRNLFIVACEDDARDDKIRSTIGIYELSDGPAEYPTLVSANRPDGTPIPWAALSGLASDPAFPNSVYTIHDSFYQQSRVYRIGMNGATPRITDEIVLNDANGLLLNALNNLKANLPGTDDFDPNDLVNGDGTVNLDLEGVDVVAGGYGWVASEGAGNLDNGVSDPDDRPFESPNILARVAANGTIQHIAIPPLEVTRNQFRFGFEGVASVNTPQGEVLFVAFQREWENAGDPDGFVRIGRYEVNSGDWTFAHYPLDAPTSENGGWVGLSEITYTGQGNFLIVERDNQGGPDATIKRIYGFNAAGVDFKPAADVANFDVVNKFLLRDLLASGNLPVNGGLVLEKIEGLTVLPNGDVLIVNDNDGVDDNSGETRLLNIGPLFGTLTASE